MNKVKICYSDSYEGLEDDINHFIEQEKVEVLSCQYSQNSDEVNCLSCLILYKYT